MDIVGLGALNVDFITKGDEWSEDKRNRILSAKVREQERPTNDLDAFVKVVRAASAGTGHVQAYGGSAYNTLRALASLDPGLKLGFVGALGDPPAELNVELTPARRRLRTQGIQFGGPKKHDGPGGMSLSVLEGPERTLSTFFDEEVPHSLRRKRDKAARFISSGRLVHVTSIFGPDGPEVILDIVERALKRNPELIISFDPGDVWAQNATETNAVGQLVRLADYLFVNHEELSALATPIRTDPERARRVFDKFGRAKNRHEANPVVLLKEWDRAAMFHGRGNGTYARQTVLPSSLIADSTGAGDVFAAGVLAALMSTRVGHSASVHLGLAAARQKLQHLGDDGYESLSELFDEASPRAGGVFLSHATADRQAAGRLVTLLESTVRTDVEIFCSSVSDRGITIGDDPLPVMHDRLEDADLVILLVTDAYLSRPFCLYEVGAAWGLRKDVFTLILRELKGELDDLVRSKQYGFAGDPAVLDELYERLRRLGFASADIRRWERLREQFQESLAADHSE